MKTLVKYGLIFCLAFAIAGTAGYVGIGMFTRSAPEIILPDLTGKDIIAVLEILTRMGLNPKLHGTQYHETIPKYGVTVQDPKPGATIKKGRDVAIYISRGFKESQVPDLRQVPLEQGLLVLEENQLKPGPIAYVHSGQTPKGSIIAQYPLPLTLVATNGLCSLLVSKGPEPISRVMPDLTGMPIDDAVNRLGALALSLGEIRSKFDPKRPENSVLNQTPKFGTRVFQGMPIALVANNPEPGLVMDPKKLKGLIRVSHWLKPGFSNQHVRVVIDWFGAETKLYNEYMKPGKEINILIPAGIKTKVQIFIDHRLVKSRTINPWNQKDTPPWESWTRETYIGDLSWE